jgi:acetyl esterase/lipase
MLKTKYFLFFILILSLFINSCKKKGCTDILAVNYNETVKKDDGSCIYNENENTTALRIQYGVNTRQNYDLFLPQNYNENTKIILLIHGGAWVLGPLDNDSIYIFGAFGIDLKSKLLTNGYGVAEMKYTLACYSEIEADLSANPLLNINPMLEDIEAAIEKLKTDAAILNYSREYAIVGESAGGHLALLFGLKSIDPELKTVVSFYAPTLLDETDFKTNANNPPYTNFNVNNIFALNDQSLDCNLRTSGVMNIGWALNSFTGFVLDPATSGPSVIDTLNPANENNIQNNIPLFLMHGLSDNLVPHFHGDSLLTKLHEKFGTTPLSADDFEGQHKLKKYANCGHGWSGGACNKNEIRNDLIKWLTAHL